MTPLVIQLSLTVSLFSYWPITQPTKSHSPTLFVPHCFFYPFNTFQTHIFCVLWICSNSSNSNHEDNNKLSNGQRENPTVVSCLPSLCFEWTLQGIISANPLLILLSFKVSKYYDWPQMNWTKRELCFSCLFNPFSLPTFFSTTANHLLSSLLYLTASKGPLP